MKKNKMFGILLFAALILSMAFTLNYASASSTEGKDDENTESGEKANPSEDIDQQVQDELSKYDFHEWSEYIEEDSPLFDDKSADELIESYLNGEGVTTPENILEALLESLKSVLTDNIAWMLSIIAIAIASGIADALIPKSDGIREAAGLIMLIMTAGIITAVFSKSCSDVTQAITRLSEFSNIATPVLSVMLTATGASATAGMVSPLMAFLSNGMTAIIRTVIMPMILFGGALCIVSNISSRLKLDKMQGFIKSTAKWSIGLLSTVYMGTLAIKGLVAASYDGLGIKTAKYLFDKSLPVAGGIISGTMDTVFYCASLVKGAAGAAAIVIALSIIVMPLLRILGTILALRLSSALSEPLGGSSTAKLLSTLADWTSYLFSVTAVIGAMFVITMGLIAHLYGG